MGLIDTRFHGRLTIDESDVITLDYEILGFPAYRRYILLPHRADSPFLYLQSVDAPWLAFIAMDPLLVAPDYTLPVNELPDLGDPAHWAVLGLCSISDGHHGTINLRSPVIINRETRRGGQFVLSLPYSHQHPLFREGAYAGAQPKT